MPIKRFALRASPRGAKRRCRAAGADLPAWERVHFNVFVRAGVRPALETPPTEESAYEAAEAMQDASVPARFPGG
ncbi:uncharacterized protein BXZ73DRAFT_104581 [Epithele typhae]|uniref:uncharacterized protein n=1 Tax=Epithele typhae TaxID=378194 RepID=UPI002007D147|nr:uncharacterized protein BXZ73DRAFT_104581 [Epithele typhae]KAH9920845.1 hypothetical protein BXZ73DRAFT_104581 [Epithele typhae]